jgi:hypothetical protein
VSIAFCEFADFAAGDAMRRVMTIHETRLARLQILLREYGSVAELNEALGWPRPDVKLMQIKNQNERSGRGKVYQMGDAMARTIEQTLGKPRGWMDTPPSYAEMNGEDDPRAKLQVLMEQMPQDQWPLAIRLLDALAQPSAPVRSTGTG